MEYLTQAVDSAGVWGYFLFIALFIIGLLLNIPGTLFVVLGVIAFGWFESIFLAYIGSVAAGVLHFKLFNRIAGNALGNADNKFINRLMNGVEKHPLRTVILVRMFLYISPPANFALMLSGIALRPLIVGTMIGNVSPTISIVLLTHFGFATFVS